MAGQGPDTGPHLGVWADAERTLSEHWAKPYEPSPGEAQAYNKLIHFNKGWRQWKDPVALAHLGGSGGYSMVKLVGSAQFLGVWLDWKLS
jgi:hypothetical protein